MIRWWMLILVGLLFTRPAVAGEEVLEFGSFGQVTVYTPPYPAKAMVLFLSGDGRWNSGVVQMARHLVSLGAAVAGVNTVHYLQQLETSSSPCSYPAGDLEVLSKFVQKKIGLSDYLTPILIGYSSGATLAYATLVEAPASTFKGAISLGFCPDLPIRKPFCKGSGLTWTPGPGAKGVIFQPASTLEVPWVALQGTTDVVCSPDSTLGFVAKVRNASVVILPKVGHGFSVERSWLPQFRHAFESVANRAPIAAPVAGTVGDLPLHEVPASSNLDLMAVHITGDGGWGVTDRGIADELAGRGIPVVALNALHYFWKPRSPQVLTEDLSRVLQYYMQKWGKDRAILIGYSLGAEVLPFAVNQMSDELRRRIGVIVLLGPGPKTDFQFHLTDWLTDSGGRYMVEPEIERIRGPEILCVAGKGDSGAVCGRLESPAVRQIVVEGGHRIGRRFQPIVDAIIEEIGVDRADATLPRR